VVPTVRTERLVLRGWRPEDRAPYAALRADPAVAEYLGGGLDRAASDAAIAAYEGHWAREGFGMWAIEVPGVAPLAGAVGLERVPAALPFAPAVEVAWRLQHGCWGRGYATEGARAALTYAFESVGLDDVVAFTAADNVRSRRVMARLGMTRDPAEDFEHPRLAAGAPLRPHVLYRVTAAAWP
jgi:RimJ/RimL family protein N-acetyltransferase